MRISDWSSDVCSSDLRVLLGDRETGCTEQAGGEVLVAGDVDRDRARLRGHRGADPLGVHTLAELDQRVLVEPDPRDVARHGLVDDGLGGGSEGGALGPLDAGLERGLPVEEIGRASWRERVCQYV